MAFKMSVLQIPQALLVHNVATKNPCRALFIEPFRCTFIVEYKLIWTVILQRAFRLISPPFLFVGQHI